MSAEICMIDYDFKKKSLTIYLRTIKVVGIQETGEVNAFEFQTDDPQLVESIMELGEYNPNK